MKSINEFYTDKYAPNGYKSMCKACEIIRNHTRNQTPERKKYNAEWRKKHQYEKRSAVRLRLSVRSKVKHALSMGMIKKDTRCACCGSERPLQAHHRDYSKPLKVIWLCSPCHGFLHTYLRRSKSILKTPTKKEGK